MEKLKDKYEVEKEYEAEITYECPKRGTVTEKVKVKRYSSEKIPEDRQLRF